MADIGRMVIPAGVASGSATELYLAAILAELQDVKALLQPSPVVTPDATEPTEIELTEPAEPVTSKRKKKS